MNRTGATIVIHHYHLFLVWFVPYLDFKEVENFGRSENSTFFLLEETS